MMQLTIIVCLLFVSLGLPQTQLHTIFLHPKDKPESFSSGKSIINGNEASPHQFPYQVGIFIQKSVSTSFCGGSLISANYVLTAAHCLEKAIQATVVLGAHNITATEDSQIRIVSNEFIVPSGWSINTMDKYDIALIKLPSPVEETFAIKTVNIATGTDTFENKSSVLAGWGFTKNTDTDVTQILRYITPNILSNTDCINSDPSYEAIISDTLLCTSGDGYRSACEGDSGGPLVVDGVQVGIVSFGSGNCEDGRPSIFTRVTEYADWIAENSDIKF